MNSRCPLCDGTGWVERVDNIGYDGHITMVKCADPARTHLEKELERLGRVSGLLPEELAITFKDVILTGETAQMTREAQRFLDSTGGFFTMWGGYGNGKTLILQAAVNEFRARGMSGTYVRMRDLLDYVRAGYDAHAKTDSQARYERFKALPVLAIDEVDGARMTDFAYEFRGAFLDDRYRLGLTGRAHTLFAMNCDPATLPGDIYDRLRDGRFTIFHNRDSSLRGEMGRR